MKTDAKKSSSTTQPALNKSSSAPFFSKTGEGTFFSSASPSIQARMRVGKPGDKLEQEADRMAGKIMRMSEPAATQTMGKDEKIRRRSDDRLRKKENDKLQKAPVTEEKPQKQEDKKLQKKEADGSGSVSAGVQSAITGRMTGGQALSKDVRNFMEPRFNADFSSVRIHDGKESAKLSNQLGARAFTYRNHIFFAGDQYRPGTSEGKQLLAHELTHTIQQGHAIQRSPQGSTTPTQPHIQRSAVGEILDWFADKARHIPGFRMFTIVLGLNPINMSAVDRSAANILRALVEFMPGGAVITQALDNHGIFSKVAGWLEEKIKALGMVGSMFSSAIPEFVDSIGWTDLAPWNWGSLWNRAKRIFTAPIDQLIDFASGVVTDILTFVKDAILKPLAAMAQGTRGYDLLCALLGADPITGEAVPGTADTLIGGFMKLIGQGEIWENIKKGNAVARAWAWFQGALAGLLGFARSIPQKIVQTITSLTIQDIITVAGAFTKIVSAFANIAGSFMSWAFNQVVNLLEILFSVVAPGVMPYLKKARSAFTAILKNPIGFVGNLVQAGKKGFQMFAGNILKHLKAALIKWLVGPLAEAGVYIPKSFSLTEIIKLVLSVLGLTWQNIRTRLVKIIPEPVLAGLEKTAGILVTLVREGPVAAWEQIKAELSELKDQLVAEITRMISIEVVKAAVMKLVSMLNPAGAVIQAIIAIYNTITFFIEKINQIAAVVASFIDSVSAIAAGQVDAAAKKVETTMANTLTVVIAFLAKFAGLGGIPTKIVGIIRKIRKPIDKGLDKIVAWLGKMLGKVKTAAKAGISKILSWWTKKVPVTAGGEKHNLTFQGKGKNAKLVLRSTPEKPSVFLETTGKKKDISDSKRKQPVDTTITHENKIESILTDLRAYDEQAQTPAGEDVKKADTLMEKLDTKMIDLSTHIVTTLNQWGVTDDVIRDLKLPRGNFTVEQKRGIARQHPNKNDLKLNSQAELINLQQGLARRHVVSSYDMARHYGEALNGKKTSEGKLLLEQRGSIAASRTKVDDLNQESIHKAAQVRYGNFFGYLKNMFIGDSRENSSIQEHLDQGHPDLADQKLEEHVSHIKRAWAIESNMKISRLNED
ncbi:eCIS core domain-containing protein [Chlorobium limicola]